MHNINLQVEDNIYQNIMFLLNNLNLSGLKIQEENSLNTLDFNKSKKTIDFSAYKIESFKKLDDPVEWQKKTRDEWN